MATTDWEAYNPFEDCPEPDESCFDGFVSAPASRPSSAPVQAVDDAPRSHEVATTPVPGFEGVRAASLSEVVEPMMARFRLAAEFPDAGAEPTGLAELDRYVRLMPGRLTVVGGREGSGKSALMLQCGRAISHRGPVLYVLTEMTLEEVVTRIVAATAHVEAWKVERGARPDLLAQVEKTLQWLAENSQLSIVEAQGMSVGQIVSAVRAFAQAKGGVRAVFIDNLWGVALASKAGEARGGMSYAMGDIARQLAVLSMPVASGGVNAPVILAHHLNREAAPGVQAKFKAGGPGTENLGGSDQIGYWASHVLTITRNPRPENPDNPFGAGGVGTSEEPDSFTLGVHKNRGGRPGISIPLSFYGAQQRFEDHPGTARPLEVPVPVDVTREDAYRARLAELPEL